MRIIENWNKFWSHSRRRGIHPTAESEEQLMVTNEFTKHSKYSPKWLIQTFNEDYATLLEHKDDKGEEIKLKGRLRKSIAIVTVPRISESRPTIQCRAWCASQWANWPFPTWLWNENELVALHAEEMKHQTHIKYCQCGCVQTWQGEYSGCAVLCGVSVGGGEAGV